MPFATRSLSHASVNDPAMLLSMVNIASGTRRMRMSTIMWKPSAPSGNGTSSCSWHYAGTLKVYCNLLSKKQTDHIICVDRNIEGAFATWIPSYLFPSAGARASRMVTMSGKASVLICTTELSSSTVVL